jgi:hypothetical protein
VQCLRVLQSKFDSQSRCFAPDQEIAEALKRCPIGQEMNLKQVHKLCMPFIKLKKDGARDVGPQALDLKLPFGEMALHHHSVPVYSLLIRLAPARDPKGFCTLNIEDQMILYALQQRPLNGPLSI